MNYLKPLLCFGTLASLFSHNLCYAGPCLGVISEEGKILRNETEQVKSEQRRSEQSTPEQSTANSKPHLHEDLTAYVAKMEKSSLQKSAFAALAHPGLIVDLGTGSGIAARDLALLFPDSQVIGVDLDEKMVNYAKEHYALPNLDFIVGNAEDSVFPANSLNAVFMSSVGHHLTSYGKGVPFDVSRVAKAIWNNHKQLKYGDIFILRDFVISPGPDEVFLDLATDDGTESGDIEHLSTAALFELFAADFRSSQHPNSGVPYQVTPIDKDEQTKRRRYRMSHRDAVEFILRKDYRESYFAEIPEEYTYFTQSEFENALLKAGFRVLLSSPIFNPWIIENRFKNRFTLQSLAGKNLPFPATNYVIVGEKIRDNEATRIDETNHQVTKDPKFLSVRAMQQLRTGEIYDVVGRPHDTIDMLPFFRRKGRLFVYGHQAYPRPILTTLKSDELLNGASTKGYSFEPVSFVRTHDQAQAAEIERELQSRMGIEPNQLLRTGSDRTYTFYTSPALVTERVTSIAIPIKKRKFSVHYPKKNESGLSSSGAIRPIEATQLLMASQAGSILDSRMEIATYNLLLNEKLSIGPWIGEEIHLVDNLIQNKVRIKPAFDVLSPRRRLRVFQEVDRENFGQFLEVRTGQFADFDRHGNTVLTTEREYIVPKEFSNAVISVIPSFRMGNNIFVGIERRNLPGIQLNEGYSDIAVNPAWRIPKEITTLESGIEFVKSHVQSDFGLTVLRTHGLGGAYHPTPGLAPEIVYPVVVEVDPSAFPAKTNTPLVWVDLADLIRNRRHIKDGHLLVVAFRLAHATLY
jgi:SAM-dependent methyltransferase